MFTAGEFLIAERFIVSAAVSKQLFSSSYHKDRQQNDYLVWEIGY